MVRPLETLFVADYGPLTHSIQAHKGSTRRCLWPICLPSVLTSVRLNEPVTVRLQRNAQTQELGLFQRYTQEIWGNVGVNGRIQWYKLVKTVSNLKRHRNYWNGMDLFWPMGSKTGQCTRLISWAPLSQINGLLLPDDFLSTSLFHLKDVHKRLMLGKAFSCMFAWTHPHYMALMLTLFCLTVKLKTH